MKNRITSCWLVVCVAMLLNIVPAQAGETLRVGYFDLGAIKSLLPSGKSLQLAAQTSLREQDDNLKKAVEKLRVGGLSQKELAVIERRAKTELSSRKKACDELVQKHEFTKEERNKLNKALKNIAESKNLNLVIGSSAVYVGRQLMLSNGVDITDAVAKQMNLALNHSAPARQTATPFKATLAHFRLHELEAKLPAFNNRASSPGESAVAAEVYQLSSKGKLEFVVDSEAIFVGAPLFNSASDLTGVLLSGPLATSEPMSELETLLVPIGDTTLRGGSSQKALDAFETAFNSLQKRDGEIAAVSAVTALNEVGTEGAKTPFGEFAVVLAYFGYTQSGKHSEAAKMLEQSEQYCDKTAWPYPAMKYLANRISESTLLTFFKSQDQEAQAHFCVALNKSLTGKDAATDFQWLTKNLPTTNKYAEFARVFNTK